MFFLKKFKKISRLTIIFILLFLLNFSYLSIAKNTNWDDEWSYYQEIIIPFDTSLEIAKFQPIDTTLKFYNPCWVKNETRHSIRVICQKDKEFIELESQIYDLNYSDDEHITSCNLVFLIPKEADGSEQYFVYYDDSEKNNPDHVDHVKIEESYYRYEPIPGYALESNYYKLIDDNNIPYAVSQQGQFMGYNTCQHIYKMVDNATEVIPKNGELFAAFDFKYCYEPGLFGYSSTSQKLVSKEILVDGNLMIEFGIISTSKFNDLQTTANYKYYHLPGSDGRIHVHVKHETLKDIKIYSDAKTDGTYASLQIGGVKSKSIKELNIGKILSFMHFYNELDTIEEYSLDIDPEYIPENPDIRILELKDDVDLGKNAWISFDEGKTGVSHCIIFNSNNVVTSGTNEKNGIQLNAFQMDYPHTPGLENNIATMQACRNSFEKGDNQDLEIPKDFFAEFDAEFFSSKTQGYSVIENEAEIFRNLTAIKPKTVEIFNYESSDLVTYSLSISVHFSYSFPMGSTFSALLGKNLSYVNIELYKDDQFIYSANAVKLPMNALDDLKQLSFFEKIKAIFNSVEWKNITFFKTASFQDLEPGTYVVKVYKENPLLKQDRKYIGYTIVDLQKDIHTSVLCRDEENIDVTIIDQNNKKVQDAEVLLQTNNVTVAKCTTDEKGNVIIKAPWQLESYDLKVLYNGVIVYKEPIKLNLFKSIIPFEKTIQINRYYYKFIVSDTWDLSPGIDLNPLLINSNSKESNSLSSEKLSENTYLFSNITTGDYQLKIKYKSFTFEKDIKINSNDELNIKFPAEFKINLRILDSRGSAYNNVKILLERDNKKLEKKSLDSEISLLVPPGIYKVTIYDEDNLIAVRNIDVFSNKNFDLITKHEPFFPSAVIIFSILLLVIFIIILYAKKDRSYILFTIPICLLIISLVLPWWTIYGSNTIIQTSTNMYIIPTELVTITTNSDLIAGETAYMPDILIKLIGLIPLITIIGCLLILSFVFFKKHNKKRLSTLSLILSLFSFIIAIGIFTLGMSLLLEIGVGGLFGQGNLDVSMPGEGAFESIFCKWSPSIGFYLYLISFVIIFVIILLVFIKNKKEKIKDNKNDDVNVKGKRNIEHPLFGISTKKWMKLLEKNGGVDNKYLDRGAFITIFSICTTPARLIFKLKYSSKIKNTEIKNPPVFIIGHWRSGTTYIHELLCEDPQFCYVSLWHTMLPDSFLVLEPMKKFLSNFLPKERPMDKIEVDIDGPYEEEAGIATLNLWSFFHGLHFPKNAEEQYLKSILYQGLTDEERTEWKNNYLNFMKSVTYANNGRRLLLKDPANTARIPLLLELFPDAKFIHIYRNPYNVYLSTVKMRNRVLDKLALQEGNKDEIEKQVIENYKRLMSSFFEQQKLIPKENFIQIRYEDIVKDPLKQVKKIYSKLKLKGIENALPDMNKYLQRKKDYKTNVYKFDEKIIEHVNKHWGFTIKRWGYKPPE